ncbi:MAG TPA: RNA polymerase sigma-70 factor [Ignavibacteriaceae bacterium]|nr:RNA polymerase sigma-70 factor [Ignavibacteriaceae bacterium]
MVETTENVIPLLIEKIKAGDEGAFKQFFFIHQASIYYFIYRLISNKEAAEDITQDTFINFWLSKDKLDNTLSPKAYLYKIARNLSINHLNRRSPLNSLNEENEDMLISLSNHPEKEYDRIFLMDDYQKAISKLPERCRATFILSRFDGFEYTEIAQILGVSLQTVKNQMNKAISSLRKYLSFYLN